MDAQGPITRRRNLLAPPESRAGFDGPDPAHNFSAKPLTALMPADSTDVARIADPAPASTAATVGANPRVVQFWMNGRGSTLKDLVSMIGLEGAARLIGAFAGMRLYVPHAPQPNDSLSEVIGLAAARALAQIYGGDRIDVPNPTPRRVQIVDLHRNGISINGIARELRCTRRRVFQVLAEVRNKQRPRGLPQPQ
jgi:hypothetical protein